MKKIIFKIWYCEIEKRCRSGRRCSEAHRDDKRRTKASVNKRAREDSGKGGKESIEY